jgi:uncharacterized protein (TIGR03435 family)
MRKLIGATVTLLMAAPLSFEVASVKSVPQGRWRENKVSGDRIDFPYVTLRYCISFAYEVKEYQVSGPAWLGELRYEIAAKGSQGTRKEQLPEMMQALLAERFKLAVHHEKKEFDIYALVAGKSGPKLKESAADPNAPDAANFVMSMSAAGVGRLLVQRGDMKALADTLPRFVGRPVVDATGIQGRYDFELEFTREDLKGMAPAGEGASAPGGEFGVSIFTSVQRVGLRLETKRVALDTIAVERAEKTPTEN